MDWVSLIACGVALSAALAGVAAMGREIWPADMPEAVNLALAPALASVATLAHGVVAPEFSPLLRAAVLTLTVAAIERIFPRPASVGRRPGFGPLVVVWLPLAAIFLASWLTGARGPG